MQKSTSCVCEIVYLCVQMYYITLQILIMSYTKLNIFVLIALSEKPESRQSDRLPARGKTFLALEFAQISANQKCFASGFVISWNFKNAIENRIFYFYKIAIFNVQKSEFQILQNLYVTFIKEIFYLCKTSGRKI